MRCGYRAGVPLQQPYSKYETDNDEVRVAYKRVSEDGGSCSPLRRSAGSASPRVTSPWLPCPCPSDGCRGVTLRTLIVVVLFMIGLIVGYLIRRAVTSSSPPDCTSGHPVTSSASYKVLKKTILTSCASLVLARLIIIIYTHAHTHTWFLDPEYPTATNVLVDLLGNCCYQIFKVLKLFHFATDRSSLNLGYRLVTFFFAPCPIFKLS